MAKSGLAGVRVGADRCSRVAYRHLVIVALWAGVASAQGFTKYYPPMQYPVGGSLIRVAKNQTCTSCEYGTLAVSSDDVVTLDCHGACNVALVCRYPDLRDVPLWNAQPADGLLQGNPGQRCDSAWFRILDCQPTATSPVCQVSAWIDRGWPW